MDNAITAGNDIGLWSAIIRERMREFCWKKKQVLFDIMMKTHF